MQAIVHDRYGSPDVLELRDIERPTLDDDGVLVRIRAASLNAFDWHVMRGDPYLVRTDAGLRRPKRLVAGADLAGVVEAVGRNVTDLHPGDEVYGERGGAFAEYIVARPADLAPKPAGLTFEQAAAVPADHIVDYTVADFTKGAERYDLIIDVAAHRSVAACRRALTSNGVFVIVGAPKGHWFAPVRRPLTAVVLSRFGSHRLLPFLAERRRDDLVALTGLIEAGSLVPVIDSAFPLARTADAMRHLEAGHVRGKVVITV